jgi:hypothetical protein
VSLEVGYARRWLQNFTVTDNLLQSPGDFTRFSVVAPLDPRLPDGGGYVIENLFDPNDAVAALSNNYRTYAPNFGRRYQIYNGMEINVSARMRNGLQFQAGSSTGETVSDDCEIRAKLPEIDETDPFCHNAPGITTRLTGAASYTIPRLDVLLSATMQSSPGSVLAANYRFTNAQLRPALGRNLSNNATGLTINLLEPGAMRGERVNQIDFRVGKRLAYGRMRSTVSVDVFNLLNPDTILGYNQTFVPGGTWLRPTSVMTARTVKFTIQHDF